MPSIEITPYGHRDPIDAPVEPRCPLCDWDLTPIKRPRTPTRWLVPFGAATMVAAMAEGWLSLLRNDLMGVAGMLAIITGVVWMLADRPVYECERCHFVCDRGVPPRPKTRRPERPGS
jgi:hypothetical protein